VKPILKKKGLDLNDRSNYRPVSNLSTVSKLVERAVASQVTQHLNINNLWDEHQCAYRKHHSCESVLIHLQNYVLNAANRGEVTAVLLLDLSAAFDTIDHKILVDRLTDMGINDGALNWFMKYLEDRTVTIRVDHNDSPPRDLKNGVPQGSVLGPLLFTIYIRPLGYLISQHGVSYKIFADDVQLFVSFDQSTCIETIGKLERCVEDVRIWLLNNRLCLNTTKSDFILCGSKRQLDKFNDITLKVGECQLVRKPFVRNLGVELDETLSFERHVNMVCKNAFYYLRTIANIRRNITTHHASILVHALVLSRINYCCAALVGIKSSLLEKIQRVINAAKRIISNGKNECSATSEILDAVSLINFRALIIVWLSCKGVMPQFISEFFIAKISERNLRSNDELLLQLPLVKTEMGKRAFAVAAARLWNSIPADVKCSSSTAVFRVKIKKILLCK
jgi:hypothetical protein